MILKRATGNIRLLVVNPNDEIEKQTKSMESDNVTLGSKSIKTILDDILLYFMAIKI